MYSDFTSTFLLLQTLKYSKTHHKFKWRKDTCVYENLMFYPDSPKNKLEVTVYHYFILLELLHSITVSAAGQVTTLGRQTLTKG